MNRQTRDVLKKTVRFSVDIIAFSRTLPQDAAGWAVARQIIRSATSIGANFREAQYARSRPEFVSKVQIALQEASETQYWLEVVKESHLGDPTPLASLRNEANQLASILTAVCDSTKRNSRKASGQS
jgi:four helix bundle protein